MNQWANRLGVMLGMAFMILAFQNCAEENTLDNNEITTNESTTNTIDEVNNTPPTTTVEQPPVMEPPGPYKGLYGFKPFIVPANQVTLNPGQEIAAALLQLANLGGGTLILNAGNFTANNAIIPPNVEVKGQGPGVTVVVNNTANPAFVINSSGSNFIIRDLTVNATANTHDGIAIYGAADNVLMDNIEVFGPQYSGIAVVNNNAVDFSEDITFNNITAYGAVEYNGLYMLKVRNGSITNCKTFNNQQYGAYIIDSDTVDVGFNDFSNNVGVGLTLQTSLNILDHDNTK